MYKGYLNTKIFNFFNNSIITIKNTYFVNNIYKINIKIYNTYTILIINYLFFVFYCL